MCWKESTMIYTEMNGILYYNVYRGAHRNNRSDRYGEVFITIKVIEFLTT